MQESRRDYRELTSEPLSHDAQAVINARPQHAEPDTLGLPLRVGEAKHYRTGESFGRGLEILNVDGLTIGNALPHARPEIVHMVNAYPAMLAALRYAQGEACGGCGDCLICRTLKEAE